MSLILLCPPLPLHPFDGDARTIRLRVSVCVCVCMGEGGWEAALGCARDADMGGCLATCSFTNLVLQSARYLRARLWMTEVGEQRRRSSGPCLLCVSILFLSSVFVSRCCETVAGWDKQGYWHGRAMSHCETRQGGIHDTGMVEQPQDNQGCFINSSDLWYQAPASHPPSHQSHASGTSISSSPNGYPRA